MTLGLGLACGAVAALPFVTFARRERVRSRARVMAVPRGDARRHRLVRVELVTAHPLVAAVRAVLGAPARRRRARRRAAVVQRDLPVLVDLVAVAVGAGCTPRLAIEHAASFCPGRSAGPLREVTRACALGRSLDEALRDLALSVPQLRGLAETLRASERLGAPAVPALARLASEVRADVRRRAEARARTVPVRLCFPLVACVLPAFALLTVVPVVLGGMHG